MARARSGSGGRRGARPLALALLAAACAVPVPFAEDLLFSTERAQLPSAGDCERCHRAVYDEWKDSPHAFAWRSESFARVTAGHTAEPCLGCHAPGALGTEGEIALRADHRDEGVTCISCHLSTEPHDGKLAMRGPHARTGPIAPHPVIVDPLFLKPELCGTCHRGVLEQWQASPVPASGERETCQHCHMPEVRRTIESYNPDHAYSAVFVALLRDVPGRRHLFAVPDDAGEDVALRAPDGGGPGLRIEVHNHLPHAIPTGTFGRREARLRVRWPGGERSARLRADLEQAIGAGAQRLFEFPDVPADAAWSAVLERRTRTGNWEPVAALARAEPAR